MATPVSCEPLKVEGRGPTARRPLAMLLLVSLAFLSACASLWDPTDSPDPIVGPQSGSLLLAGGGELGTEIWERFIQQAGGDGAHIVVIPTAGAEDEVPDGWHVLNRLREAGAHRVEILHTRDPDEADSESFVAPLMGADGVWIPGGRQGRLVDAYLDTRTHDALLDVLERGGVIGGTSAGASIQASYLVRGDPETNQTVMAEGYEEGFGFLSDVGVDQHLSQRNRQDDLWKVVSAHPDHLGIGIDEGTAVVVEGDDLEVVGRGAVLIYTFSVHPRSARRLEAGGRFDLGYRLVQPSTPQRQTEELDASQDDPDPASQGEPARR